MLKDFDGDVRSGPDKPRRFYKSWRDYTIVWIHGIGQIGL